MAKLVSGFILAVMIFSLNAESSHSETKPKPTYYSDCATLNLAPVDDSMLTQEELLARKYEVLLDALEHNAQCMEKAASSGQAQQIASGGGAGSGIGGSGSSLETESTTAQPSSPESPKNSQGQSNQVITGSSAGPCALYKNLLKEATTDAERSFYEAELKKYQCR